MKTKRFSAAVLAGLLCVSAFAQDAKPQLKWYGFIRNYYALDTRESVAGTEDFFYYVPKDWTSEENDANAVNTFRFAALTSRLGVDVSGYEINGWKVGAKIEADFYNGVSGVTGTAVFRLRQAFLTMANDAVSIKAGQAWHPMAADMPDVFSLNTGAPFGPFSRTPLTSVDWKLGKDLSLTAAAIWQMQYVSAGPNGASADYMKYGCIPELYLGLNEKFDGGLVRLGVDVLSISPSHSMIGGKMHKNRITTVSPFLYAQYASGNFSAKFKTIYAQAGEHVNLNGGYGISAINEDGSIEYTPTLNSSSWLSLKYKAGKTDLILFGGFVKNFGTKDDLVSVIPGSAAYQDYAPASNLYFSKNSFSNMNAMWRLTPTVVYNLGKVALGLEYEITSVQYGDYKTLDFGDVLWPPFVETRIVKCIPTNGLATNNLHWITNNRLQLMFKYTF